MNMKLYRKKNNSIFEGEIEKNKFNGYTIEIFDDGSSYYSEFKNNEKYEVSIYDWGHGTHYQRNWKNRFPNGIGVFSVNKNRIYEGEKKNWKIHKIGLFKCGEGRKYFGYYIMQREGFGIFFLANPLKMYAGFKINRLQNGVGKIYTSFNY